MVAMAGIEQRNRRKRRCERDGVVAGWQNLRYEQGDKIYNVELHENGGKPDFSAPRESASVPPKAVVISILPDDKRILVARPWAITRLPSLSSCSTGNNCSADQRRSEVLPDWQENRQVGVETYPTLPLLLSHPALPSPSR
jgi:hypothetical protein